MNRPRLRSGAGALLALLDLCLGATLWAKLSQPWLALGVHLLASLGIAALACHRETRLLKGLFAALCFFLPLACVPILLRPRERAGREEEELSSPRLIRRPNADYLSLGDINSPQTSFAQLMRLRGEENTHAVPALRDKLQDADDEVRLLAFAMLDRREGDIQRRIQQARERLESRETQMSASLHQALAESHLDLVHSGLATGAFATRGLETAEDHCRRGLAARPSASLLMLLAKILFEQKKYDDCRHALFDALRHGTPAYPVLLMMAELAFEERRFDLVAQCLARLEQLEGSSETAVLRKFWARRNAA